MLPNSEIQAQIKKQSFKKKGLTFDELRNKQRKILRANRRADGVLHHQRVIHPEARETDRTNSTLDMTHTEHSEQNGLLERDATLLIEDVDDVSVDDYQKNDSGKQNLLRSTFNKLYNKAFVTDK